MSPNKKNVWKCHTAIRAIKGYYGCHVYQIYQGYKDYQGYQGKQGNQGNQGNQSNQGYQDIYGHPGRPYKCPTFYTTMISGEQEFTHKKKKIIKIAINCRTFSIKHKNTQF